MYIVKINDKRASDILFSSRKKAYKWLKKSVKKTGEKLIGDSTKGFIGIGTTIDKEQINK